MANESIFDTNIERDLRNPRYIFDDEMEEMYKWVDIMDGGDGKISKPKSKTNPKRKPVIINNVADFMDSGDDIVYKLNDIEEGDDLVSESILRWKDGNFHYYVNSEIFNRRFLTLFINDILSGIKKIVPRMFENDTGENEKVPKKYYKLYLNRIFGTLVRFTNQIMSGKMTLDVVCEAIDTSIYLRKANYRKYRKILKDGLTSVLIGCQPTMGGDCTGRDDELIYSIIRIAFMLSTGSINFKEIPGFKKIQGMSVSDDISEIIIRLGYAITNKKYKERTPLYNAFKLSLPLIKTNIEDANDSLYFNVGIRAIYIVGYISGDKNVRKFISHIIND